MWDAAYVLGSLSSAERREFEAHMTGCPLCANAIGELSGMPALFRSWIVDELAAIDDRCGRSSRRCLTHAAVPAGQGEIGDGVGPAS